MRKFKGADETLIGPANTKGKLIIMCGAAVGLVALLFYVQTTYVDRPEDVPVDVDVAEEVIELPSTPPGTFDEVSDADDSDRFAIEAAQMMVVRAALRRATANAIAAAGSETLDGATWQRVMDAPGPERGTYFTARGELLDLARRSTGVSSSDQEYAGTVRTSDGHVVHFRAADTDDTGLSVGDWVRVDGMFFKILIEEDPATGDRLEGPLLACPEMLASYPDYGKVTSIEPALWDMVRDDTLNHPVGPRDEFVWRLLAWMRDASPEQLPPLQEGELDDATLVAINANGADFRGKRFHTPVCRVQAYTVRTAGENPARMEKSTEVWLGNNMWTHQYVVRVLLPGEAPRLELGQLVTADLVYVQNYAYDTGNERRVAPMFVTPSIETYTPPRETALQLLLLTFTGVLALIVVVIAVLVRRDQKRSRALAEKLVQRRRTRRGGATASA
ncbi:MAG: hypothetical protein R3F34_13260 [Planctomycetota bacterium]